MTGMTPFEYFAANEQFSAIFNRAMAEHTRAVAPGLVAARYGTVADLGGDGSLLAEA